MIWNFKCPICKKNRSGGRDVRYGIMKRWICFDCIHEGTYKKRGSLRWMPKM